MRIDEKEALRYLGIQNPDAEAVKSVSSIARDLEKKIQPRSLYRVFFIRHDEDKVFFPEAGFSLEGRLAQKMLCTSQKAAVIICTLGVGFDSLLRSCQSRDMARAVMLDACGSAYVEKACDEMENEIRRRHPSWFLTDRFSPGYGDLPMQTQKDLLLSLNAEKLLGVYLMESLLINPSKTVTAIVGLSHSPQMARIRGCKYCALQKTCEYKKRGTSCQNEI